MQPLGAGDYLSPAIKDRQILEFGYKALPFVRMNEVWNKRLIWHTEPTVSFVDRNGNDLSVDLPTSSHLICQRTVRPDFSLTGLVFNRLVTCKSDFMPTFQMLGDHAINLFIKIPAAITSHVSTELTGRSFFLTEQWKFGYQRVIPAVVTGDDLGEQINVPAEVKEEVKKSQEAPTGNAEPPTLALTVPADAVGLGMISNQAGKLA